MSVFTLQGLEKAVMVKAGRVMARTLGQQCKAHRKRGGEAKLKYRCQWKTPHKGKHIDFMGKEWS